MKLDHDFARLLLLKIESSDSSYGLEEPEGLELAESLGFTREQLAYTIDKLSEAGFITGKTKWRWGEPYFIMPGNLTYSGHEYLDTVRSPKIWRDSKTLATKVGSVSLDIMGQIAASLISKTLGLN